MNWREVKTKTGLTVACFDPIYSSSFARGAAICIPTDYLERYDDQTILDSIKDAKKYAEAMTLLWYQFDDGYFKHADERDIPYLQKILEYASKIKNTDIPLQLGIDIDRIIKDCIAQMKFVEEEKEREKKKQLLAEKKNERKLETGFIYIIKSEHGYKIGKSKRISKRMNTLGIQVPFNHDCIIAEEIKDYHSVEKEIHEHFKEKRIKGEWFRLDEEDIQYIKDYLSQLKNNNDK